MRGKKKCKWTHGERKILWECFVRSGGEKTGGYIKKIKALWDEKGLSVREKPSLVSQLKCINIENGLVTKMERDKIEKRMGNETRKIKGNENRKMMISSDEWNALFGESDSEEEFEGFKAEDIEKCVGGVVKSHAATVCM